MVASDNSRWPPRLVVGELNWVGHHQARNLNGCTLTGPNERENPLGKDTNICWALNTLGIIPSLVRSFSTSLTFFQFPA
jgi:hypothetical protein